MHEWRFLVGLYLPSGANTTHALAHASFQADAVFVLLPTRL